ncbi:MAG: hypothetical protein KF712_00870 [Akkermansiaceae bacterium]|nr:hypothetical protein [Akkermansiaceae bacterium]
MAIVPFHGKAAQLAGKRNAAAGCASFVTDTRMLFPKPHPAIYAAAR